MQAYSPDLRAKILAAVDAGRPKTEVARSFGVSLASVKRYVVQRRERGSLEPLPRPGRPPTITPEQEDALWQQLCRAANGDPGRALCHLGAVPGGATRALHHEPGYPQAGVDPKKRTVGAAERDEVRRTRWHRLARKVDAARFVFVDESGANITLAPRYGRAPKGHRCSRCGAP